MDDGNLQSLLDQLRAVQPVHHMALSAGFERAEALMDAATRTPQTFFGGGPASSGGGSHAQLREQYPPPAEFQSWGVAEGGVG